MSRSGWFRKQQTVLATDGTAEAKPVSPRRKGRAVALVASSAAMVLAAGIAIVALGVPGSHAAPATPAEQASAAAQDVPAVALQMLSVTPASGAKAVNGAAPIRVQFSAPLAASSPMPQLSPSIAGHWQVEGDSAVFTPAVGYFQNTKVTVKIPGGQTGMISVAGANKGAGGLLGSSVTESFTTGSFSTLRLQELFSQLNYLPFTWTPKSATVINPASANAELSAAYSAPAGTFAWNGDYPSELTDQWTPGSDNILDTGAIRAFESVQGLTMDGYAGNTVWSDLLAAVGSGKNNPNGYTYALASQDSPHETLKVWHNGKLILDTPANTGVAGASTVDGTFPVYERLPFQIMKGTNLDGTKYADPVQWISYFNGGDAVHYFERPGYGYYQSLGCVELPLTPAKFIYPYLTYGTLVTVTGPVA